MAMSPGLALREAGSQESSAGGFRRAELARRELVWTASCWARITQAGPSPHRPGPRPRARLLARWQFPRGSRPEPGRLFRGGFEDVEREGRGDGPVVGTAPRPTPLRPCRSSCMVGRRLACRDAAGSRARHSTREIVPQPARSSLNPRARHSGRRARGLSDDLADRGARRRCAPDAETCTSHSSGQFQPHASGPRRTPP